MTTWSYPTKNPATWAETLDYLLQEMGDFLLLEDGGKMILEPSIDSMKHTTTWTDQNKS